MSHRTNKIPTDQPAMVAWMEKGLFASRWIQAPLYFGLIAAQCVYVVKFFQELFHVLTHMKTISETMIMLVVLGLIDIVMISNLLFMVILGGYATFVSRVYIENHPDKPEWFSHVDAGVLKVKLSLALIGISSIHLLKTFVDIANMQINHVIGQVGIHTVFIISAYYLAKIDLMMKGK